MKMVGTDLFYVHDIENRRHQLLSIVDFSSAYQVVVPVHRKDTATLEKAFCEKLGADLWCPLCCRCRFGERP